MKSSFKSIELILILFLLLFFLGFECNSNAQAQKQNQNYGNVELFRHPQSSISQNSQVNFHHTQNSRNSQFYRSSSANESIYLASSFPPEVTTSSFTSTYPMQNPQNNNQNNNQNNKKPEEIPLKPAPKPQIQPEIPLPSPPKPIIKPAFGFLLPPPFSPPRPPEELVPVGFDKIVLLLVPQFKIPIKTKKWWKADVKLSLPITVFFDKLVVPVNSPPLIFFPFGPVGTIPPQKPPTPNENGNEDKPKYPSPPARKMDSNSNWRISSRRKRSSEDFSASSSGSILSLPPPESVKGGERATLVSRVENIVESFGLEGRSCLLRAVCEVHQHELHKNYGFLGEIITLLLTVSNSAYAESHLPEYFKAEQLGKDGKCQNYFPNCTESILHHHNQNQEENDNNRDNQNLEEDF